MCQKNKAGFVNFNSFEHCFRLWAIDEMWWCARWGPSDNLTTKRSHVLESVQWAWTADMKQVNMKNGDKYMNTHFKHFQNNSVFEFVHWWGTTYLTATNQTIEKQESANNCCPRVLKVTAASNHSLVRSIWWRCSNPGTCSESICLPVLMCQHYFRLR